MLSSFEIAVIFDGAWKDRQQLLSSWRGRGWDPRW